MISNTKKRLVLWLGFFLLLLSPSLAGGYDEIVVSKGGSISGFVKLQGNIPKLPPLEILKSKEACKNVPNESLVVGPDRGLRYAVVTLEGITRGKPVEREAVHELDNLKCRFVPHVQVASVGQFLIIKNNDPILHTAHAFFQDGQPQFNVGLFPGKVSRKPLVSQGVVKILCEVHPWMISYVVVTEHAYHAVTDFYGEYEIRDVPPGTYRLKVWHESLGTEEKRVEVKGGETSKADFILSLSQGVKK
ncbi:MAG: carboxypeptidase-like regulatory domain-containing protein [Deltaproteobacteria bacterium]|nr:carboxypeptidase-like regulatory domain-containing protein [Deltaproteobacteria bacterium]